MTGSSTATVIGAALIAAAILITNHWNFTPQDARGFDVIRLNRWTGRIDICTLDPTTMKAQSALVGAEFICTAK